MTRDEYREALEGLNEEALEKFKDKYGAIGKTIEDMVRNYADNPEHERRICYLLNLKTEDEKVIESALKSARAAESSAWTAKLACIVSIVAALAAIAATIAAFINLK